MSSFSSSFIDQVNTKYEALRLIKDPTRLISLLYSKYGDIEEDYYLLNANILIYNLPTKLNCLFKEMKYTNFSHDYLKRQYKIKESTSRIPKLAEYYKNYHLFFCRPTLRHYKLSKVVCNYQDKKAELFYKNNYQDSKGNNSLDKEEMNKKTSSFSLSSLDNITNNKIIFDKQTKKMLDKSETELKNNNFYNTLVLDSSRSNLLLNNGLISKRSGDDNSFEKCIHAFVDYQYNKNKNKIRKNNNKKLYIKNKKIKNIMINNENSNKYSKLKNNVSQSQRETHKFYTFKLYNNSSKAMNHKINRISNNNSSNNTNYINKIKMKKKSLYSLSNNRYNTSTTTLLNNKNHKKCISKKELNLNYPVTTTNKDSKKNKTYVYVNSINNNTNNNTINSTSTNNKNHSTTMSKIFSHSNVNSNLSPNHEAIKNLKNMSNNYKNFSKLTEYLKQSQNKENSNNLNQKAALHKKNCLSIGDVENKNLLFSLNNKNRITKKKITINKNLKIAVTNNINNVSEQRTKHTKNKTFDYNAINHTNNVIKSNNISNNEDFNNMTNKPPQKGANKMNTEIKNFTKIKKNSKSKKSIFSPSSKKIINKMPMTQTNSKDKNNKKNLTVKIISPNNRKREFNINFTKDINSTQNKRYNKCLYTNDNNIVNNFSNKDGLIKSGKISKYNYNYCLSPNVGSNNMNRIIKNVSGGAFYGAHISPTNQLLNSIGYFKRNIIINNNLNLNHNNNVYQKKSPNMKNKMHSKIVENNIVQNSCNFNNTTKELYSNNNTLTNSNNNTSINCNDYKKLSRNKKKIQNKKFNNSKKTNNINNKTNSINNQVNYNFIIDENNYKSNINKNKGNINISIEKNNINIKDSILHIDKIYIKKDNNSKNKKCDMNDIIPRVYSDADCCSSQHKKKIEIKVGDKKRIKSGIDDVKKNKEKMKFMDYSPTKINYSPKMINVHRNFNLLTKTNKEINNNYK